MRRHLFFAPSAPGEEAISMPLRFEADKVGLFPPPTAALLDEAIRLLNQNFFSDGFRTKVQTPSLCGTLGLTPKEVYDHLATPNASDNRIVLRLSVYPNDAGGGEVGVTSTDRNGRQLTSTYQQYIETNGAKCYAAHLAHEYCHWQGFRHPKYQVFGRHKAHSVPYMVGDLFAEYVGADCP